MEGEFLQFRHEGRALGREEAEDYKLPLLRLHRQQADARGVVGEGMILREALDNKPAQRILGHLCSE